MKLVHVQKCEDRDGFVAIRAINKKTSAIAFVSGALVRSACGKWLGPMPSANAPGFRRLIARLARPDLDRITAEWKAAG